MAEHQLVLEEIAQIEELLNNHYEIKNVKENLEGAYVTFFNASSNDERTLHVKMAETRKYFSSKILEQVNGELLY